MILTRIASLFAGNGLIAGAVVAVLVMFGTWKRDIKESGRQEVRASIEKNTNANAKKADAARAAVERLPADRLRDRHFRD